MKNLKVLRLIRNIVLILMLVNILVIVGYFIYLKVNSDKGEVEEVVVVDQIDSFGYVLDNSKNEYYKTAFGELKVALNNEEVNYEDYAKAISKLFVFDLYTLSNKVSSSDVGGTEFVYKDFQKDFQSIAKTTLYNSVKSNLYGEREQELPTVKEVNVSEVSKTTFKYNKTTFEEAYSVKLTLEYEMDLGYPKNCELVLVKNDKLIEIVKLG